MAYRQNARDEALRGRFWYGPFWPSTRGAAVMGAAVLGVELATLSETARFLGKGMAVGLALVFVLIVVGLLSKCTPLRVSVFGDRIVVGGSERSIDASRALRVRIAADAEDGVLERVVIDTEDGSFDVLPRSVRGDRAHRTAATKLAKLLRVPTDVAPVAPLPRLPRHAIVPLAITLTVAALAIGGVVIALAATSRTQGTLELQCNQRCRFQEFECLPGGRLSTTLPPGDYLIETWSQDRSEPWKKHTVTIRVGQRQRFVCE